MEKSKTSVPGILLNKVRPVTYWDSGFWDTVSDVTVDNFLPDAPDKVEEVGNAFALVSKCLGGCLPALTSLENVCSGMGCAESALALKLHCTISYLCGGLCFLKYRLIFYSNMTAQMNELDAVDVTLRKVGCGDAVAPLESQVGGLFIYDLDRAVGGSCNLRSGSQVGPPVCDSDRFRKVKGPPACALRSAT